jgi:hypothetical protein
MTVLLANNGPGLGTMWGEQTALARLETAGFREVEIKQVEVVWATGLRCCGRAHRKFRVTLTLLAIV